MSKEHFCTRSGAVAIEAITPPKGEITRLEERVEMAEMVVDAAMNPQEVVVGSVWGLIKGKVFGWLRGRDKSTYRP